MAETLPYGLRDVKITPLAADGITQGTTVDLPVARTFSFEEAEDFEDLRGDDKLVAMRGNGASVNWELEAGGISLEAYVVIAGGSLSETGTTPNVKKVYKKKATDARPEFVVEGQALSESGGDFHVVLHRCKATENLTGELSDGSFWLTGASGTAFPGRAVGAEDEVYQFVQNESVTAIVLSEEEE